MLAAFTLLFALVSFAAFAQENDTTKIKLKNKKIIIIDNKDSEKLEKGKMEFQTEILEIESKIAELQAQKLEQKDTLKLAEIDKQIADQQSKKAAIEKGIADIDSDLGEMEKEKDNMENKDDNDWDWDSKHDWHFNRDEHKLDGHWAGFELGINNFRNKNMELSLPADGDFMELNSAKSWQFALNFMEYTIPIYKNKIGLVTGLGFEWNGYNLKKSVRLHENESGVIVGDTLGSAKFDKNKLNTTYFNIPLILEFQFGNEHPVHISAGVIGGIKLGSNTKQEYEKDGKKYEDKVRDDYQINDFRYGATVRIGYRALNLFANYELTPLFETNKGPELYPFTIGLTLLDF